MARPFLQAIQVNSLYFISMPFVTYRGILLLGGPLVRDSTGELIGVTSFVQFLGVGGQTHLNQAFSRIHYHLEWISKTTGIHLPDCGYLNGASEIQTSKMISLICTISVFILYKFNA